jgi:HEPN domain-containing protein
VPDFRPTRSSIEEYIEHLKSSKDIGAANLPGLDELSHAEYVEAVQSIEYWRYVQAADYHYFVSRVLFLLHVTEYSFFAGHQCVENYLKAYLKSRGALPDNIHRLGKLLDTVRSLAPVADGFLHEDRASIVVERFEPFYELARYPVRRSRPKGGYAFLIPDDIYVLDYFVLRMRSLLSIPSNTWDILRDGHYNLELCKEQSPHFYRLFAINNVNFSSAQEPAT